VSFFGEKISLEERREWRKKSATGRRGDNDHATGRETHKLEI